jgi:heme-degrading monooxygenase HmoA
VSEEPNTEIAVIFTSRRTGADPAGYDAAAARMEELAARQPGSRGIESARGDDGFGITVSYWDSEESARAWKQHAEHLAVQALGRERWYEWYRVTVARVTRRYTYDHGDVASDHGRPATPGITTGGEDGTT